MIALDHVTQRYGRQGPAELDDVTLEVGRGEFVYVIGDAGSGASTLVRLATGRERPTSGRVWVAGREVSALPPDELYAVRRQVGVVHPTPRLIERLDVAGNVGFALQAIGIGRHKLRRQVADALDLTGLTDLARHLPRDLNAGQRQLVAVARAAAKQPAVLLADEPTGSLGDEDGDRIARVLGALNNADVTVVVATHDHRIVDHFRKRVVQLHGGRVVRDEFGGSYLDLFAGADDPTQTSARPRAGATRVEPRR